ncbi:MAG: CoA-binding protein [Anaerolineales bacterium]|nr:CoA-binding protein [Anaerolineales bacterium]
MSLAGAALYDLLAAAHTIAVVGHSDKPDRASYSVARYLRDAGYWVYPVNPNLRSLDGDTVYPDLRAVPGRIDIVNVFRRPEHLWQIAEDAIAIGARALWTQLGVVHPGAAQRAEAAGLVVVQDRCIMVEHRRLGLPRHS